MTANGSTITVRGIRIPKEILKRRFAPCDLQACRHACCRHGAMVGPVRIKKITRLLPKLFPLMRPEAVATVKRRGFHLATVFKRSDFDPGHDHHYLRTVRGRCVFLSYDDTGGCVLQKYAALHTIKFKIKPVGCWAFPFDLIGKRLVVYQWKNLPCLDAAKSKKAPLMIATCSDELTGLLGPDRYRQLLLLARGEQEA